jgi:hypothetical protein
MRRDKPAPGKLGKEPSNREEIGAAARAQVSLNQIGIESEHAGLETRGENAASLDEVPGLGLDVSQSCKSTPVDQIRVVIHG